MNPTLGSICILCALLAITAKIVTAQEEHAHTYAPLRDAVFEFKDFEYPSLDSGKIKFSEAANGKRVVLVHYFAAWCHNSNYDVATINEVYNKYRDRGFAVIGICEYSTKGELKKFIEKHKPSYPIYIEGDMKKRERTGTMHYAYRQKAGDDRLWGTPLNILIDTEDIKIEGEVVSRRARVATGELVKTEFEAFLIEKLK